MNFLVKKCCGVSIVDEEGHYRWAYETPVAKIPRGCVDWTDDEILKWCTNKHILQVEGCVERNPYFVLISDSNQIPILVIWLELGDVWSLTPKGAL